MRAKRRLAMMKKCLVCGIEFKVKASHYERRKCCNKKCDGIRKKTLLDENRTNNSIENLQVMSIGEHTKIHNKDFKLVHNPVNGQIIDVIRRSKINE